MEQCLIDKVKAGTLDEIDKDTIAARVKNATIKLWKSVKIVVIVLNLYLKNIL